MSVAQTGGLVARMMRAHLALGLAFLALIFTLSLTGTLAVFADELRAFELRDAPHAARVSPAAFDRAAAETLRRGPGAGEPVIVTVTGPHDGLSLLTTRIVSKEAERTFIADPATGALIREDATPVTDFLVTLHTHLHLPNPFGIYIVGLIGVFSAALVISGTLAHARVFKDMFRLRRGGTVRVENADLHNRIGTWALPFHLVNSLTGAFLGLSGLILGVLAVIAYDGDTDRAAAAVLGPQPVLDTPPAALTPVAGTITAIERDNPGAVVRFIGIQRPATAGQVGFIDASMPGELAVAERWHIGSDGTITGKAGLTDGSLAKQVFAAITPLHYGNFGGLPVKILWALLGLSMTWLCVTGARIMFARKAVQGEPHVGLQAAWRGLVWSLVGGLTALGLAYIVPMLPAVAFLSGALAGMLATVRWPMRTNRLETAGR